MFIFVLRLPCMCLYCIHNEYINTHIYIYIYIIMVLKYTLIN